MVLSSAPWSRLKKNVDREKGERKRDGDGDNEAIREKERDIE